MPKRASKSSDKVGRLSLAKVDEVVRAMRQERGPIVVPKGKIVLTNDMTASGSGRIAFRLPKPAKVGKPGARRRSSTEATMAKRVTKGVKRIGRLSPAKVREAVRAVQRELAASRGSKKRKVPFTNEMTASGSGLISFRIPKPAKVGRSDTGRRSKKGK